MTFIARADMNIAPSKLRDGYTVIHYDFEDTPTIGSNYFTNKGNGGTLNLSPYTGGILATSQMWKGKKAINPYILGTNLYTPDTVSDPTVFDPTTFTVSVWVWIDYYPSSAAVGWCKNYNLGIDTSSPPVTLEMYWSSINWNWCYTHTDNGGYHVPPDTVESDPHYRLIIRRWSMMSITFSPNNLNFYINGILLRHQTPTNIDWGAHGGWWLGDYVATTPRINQWIADFRVENVERSADYLIQAYNIGAPIE